MTSLSDKVAELQEQICLSLWLTPATLEELCARDFLQHTATMWVDRWLMKLETAGKVYERDGTYHCYKKEAQRLDKKGYEVF